MKQTLECERIILQLSIAPQEYELWKNSNLSLHLYTDRKTIVQQPESANG